MTELLYLKDAYLRENEAIVVDVTETAIVLDRTCFFPEGGGQSGDSGRIGNVKIIDAQLENGIVLHIFDKNERPVITVGERVSCEIDWEKRFSRMQAHTGEHIVSGLAHTMFGCENVGFHMDGTVMTVDFDRFLSETQLTAVEKAANACVYRDLSVTAETLSAAQEERLPYRSKLDDLENPRIVTVEGVDRCACCAPHVRSTGQIGLIKILSSMRHRGGVRLTLIAGDTAFADYAGKHASSVSIGLALAVKPSEIVPAVEALQQKNKDLTYEMNRQLQDMLLFVRELTPETTANLTFFLPSMSVEALKNAVVLLRERTKGICVALCGSDADGYYFAMSSAVTDVKVWTRSITGALNGSGGGRYDVVQGRLRASREQIEEYFKELRVNQDENA